MFFDDVNMGDGMGAAGEDHQAPMTDDQNMAPEAPAEDHAGENHDGAEAGSEEAHV